MLIVSSKVVEGTAYVTTRDESGDHDFIITLPVPQSSIVKDKCGRRQTVSGAWVIPDVEVDGEWQRRKEDPDDPWAYTPVFADWVTFVLNALTGANNPREKSTGAAEVESLARTEV